jgi:hypothetical protein
VGSFNLQFNKLGSFEKKKLQNGIEVNPWEETFLELSLEKQPTVKEVIDLILSQFKHKVETLYFGKSVLYTISPNYEPVLEHENEFFITASNKLIRSYNEKNQENGLKEIKEEEDGTRRTFEVMFIDNDDEVYLLILKFLH